jgi:hypothetical protein
VTKANQQLRKTGRSEKPARYIKVDHWVYDTAAWQDLHPLDCCIYLEFKRRYRGPGTNNGCISLSIREIAERFKVGKSTAARSLQRLQDHGFIAVSIRGRFTRRDRHTSTWRLTEYACDATGDLATKDFTRWKKNNGPTEERKCTSPGTHGTVAGTIPTRIPADGIPSGTIKRSEAA